MTTGRCDRAIILSSDDVTSEHAWDWIGAGFAASGAAATATLSGDGVAVRSTRRNGLISAWEPPPSCSSVVLRPRPAACNRSLSCSGPNSSNSAFHGTRLDVDHVAESVDSFVSDMESKWAFVVMPSPRISHSTATRPTPPLAGVPHNRRSRRSGRLGASADEVLITNTKGFTGHPMGVGIEDSSMMHGLLTGRFPPIANHQSMTRNWEISVSPQAAPSRASNMACVSSWVRESSCLELGETVARHRDRIDDARLLGWCRGRRAPMRST